MSASAPSWWLRPHPVSNYAIAVLSVAAAVVVDIVFDRLTGADPSISLFLCAIMLVAWASGTGPALLATALTILAYDYFFLRPEYSLSEPPHQPVVKEKGPAAPCHRPFLPASRTKRLGGSGFG
jgi:K+-sensing histidine kinase KdpD